MLIMNGRGDDMAELTSLKNIGKEMERKLKAVDVNSAEELKRIGGEEAFFRLKIRFPEVCLVHLYALQGAIDDIEFNLLPDEIKQRLKSFSDKL